MKSKSILKSRGQLGRRHPTPSDRIRAHAMIRRRAWRCVRPALREPHYKVLRQLERIDLRELREIVEEACRGLDHEANAGEGGKKTPVEERSDRLHQLTWLHYMGDLFGRTQPNLHPIVKANLAEFQRLLKAEIRKLKNTRR